MQILNKKYNLINFLANQSLQECSITIDEQKKALSKKNAELLKLQKELEKVKEESKAKDQKIRKLASSKEECEKSLSMIKKSMQEKLVLAKKKTDLIKDNSKC